MDRSLIRELAAECLGTFLLIAFGVGSVAQMVLSHHTAGTTLSVNISWGLAVMLGVYAAAGVSGGHLNPAVTLALAVHRRWITAMEKQIPPAIFVLLFGAALAASGIVGFSGGLAGHRALVQSVLLTVFVTAIFFVIHDLDTPTHGLSQSEREPLVHLSELLKREAQQHP